MASSALPIFLLTFLLFTHSSFAADSPEYSPSPSPEAKSPAGISVPPSQPVSPSPTLPIVPPPESPAPSPSDLTPTMPFSPAPSPSDDDGDVDDAPAPAPITDGGLRHADQSSAADMKAERESGGMSGGKKAGVAMGVIAACGVVVMGAIVYKKRQRKIRRWQYGYSAQRNIL